MLKVCGGSVCVCAQVGAWKVCGACKGDETGGKARTWVQATAC
ncbi:hypothetical protein ACO2FK_00130 [Staphylococcus epidermidis]